MDLPDPEIKSVEDAVTDFNKYRFHEPTEETLLFLEKFLKDIKSNPKPWVSKICDIILALQDIIQFSFEDNPNAVEIIKICKEIFHVFHSEFNKGINNINNSNNNNNNSSPNKSESSNNILQSVKIQDKAPVNACNFIDPHILDSEFPALCSTDKSSREIFTNDCKFLTLRKVKDLYENVIQTFLEQSRKKEDLKFLNKNDEGEWKILTTTYEMQKEYLLKVLEEKWSQFENVFQSLGTQKDIYEFLQPIYDALENVKKKIESNKTLQKSILPQNMDNSTIEYNENDAASKMNDNDNKNPNSDQINPFANAQDEQIVAKRNFVYSNPFDNPSVDPIDQNLENKLEDIFINEQFVKSTDSQSNILTLKDFMNVRTTTSDHNYSEESVKAFSIEVKSRTQTSLDETLVSTDVEPSESYIDLQHIWGYNSRWLTLKYKLLQKGVMKCTEFYTCLPIYRNEFSLGNGTFGNIEIGFSKSFHAITIRRLTEFGFSPERCDDLQRTIDAFRDIDHGNILRCYLVQDYCGYSFFFTRLCDYNLDEYLVKIKETGQFNEDLSRRISFQIVKGVTALHKFSPPIIHGNLKPSNVFIDECGVVKVAEYGIFKHIYSDNEPAPNKKKIWWSTESHMWYKFLKTYSCTSMSDIQTCGILLYFINSGGVHPYGHTEEQIILNLETNTPNISIESLDLWGLFNMMLHPDPCQRPEIAEVVNHVYFWSEDKKWNFLTACLEISNMEYGPLTVASSVARKFCSTLEEIWAKDATKFFWMPSAFIHFPGVEIPYGAWTDSGLGLLRFLNKCRHENPLLFNKQGWVLKAFPELPSLIYNALRGSLWFHQEELKKFNPLSLSDEEWK